MPKRAAWLRSMSMETCVALVCASEFTSRSSGIEIRFRNCSTVVFKGGGLDKEVRAHLRPVAHVRDANGTGKVVFSNASPGRDGHDMS